MSDKWEVVGNGKPRKPRPVNNGPTNSVPTTKSIGNLPGNVSSQKPARRKKHIGPRDSKVAKLPGSDDEFEDTPLIPPKSDTSKGSSKKSVSQPKQSGQKPKEPKPRDLESSLKSISPDQLESFYKDLVNAGSIGDVYLSWIKYSADALNTKIGLIPPPDPSQWPHNLNFPSIPLGITTVIQSIITRTAASDEDVDVIGSSYSSLLASLPTLLLRGDRGWGYLLFLREICKIDPDVGLRRSKTLTELMESYGNRKEIGTCLLWVAAQASLHSDNVLKIISEHILPYHSFKHYKNFVLTILSAVGESAVVMSSENVVEPQDFEDFFQTAFDPKRRRDFEKFYPKFRDLALRNLRAHGEVLFFNFLKKLGDKAFMPLSAYGQEILLILHGCLSNDPTLIEKWKSSFESHLKESTILLNYLAKHPESITYWKRLEAGLIQTDEFAKCAVQSPDLIRIAKKLQTGLKRVEASRTGFPWKMGIVVVLLLLCGIFYLDVTVNGNGSFAKSQTGEYLEKFGLLDEAQTVIDTTHLFVLKVLEFCRLGLRAVYEWVRPLLQIIEREAKIYIPEIVNYASTFGNYIYESSATCLNFLQQNVFVGSLSPDNMRKVAKDSLTFIWSTLTYWVSMLYSFIGGLLK